MAPTQLPTEIPTELPENPASFWGRNNRNLWIILGSVLGFLALLFLIGIILIVHRQYRRRGLRDIIIPRRSITPLDDAEFESWRKPSLKSQSYGRYTTMMPRRPSPAARKGETFKSFDKEVYLLSRPRTPSDPICPLATSMPSHVRRKSSMSLHDRPPTPYSARCSEEAEGWPAPPRRTSRSSRSSRNSRGSQGSRSSRQTRDFHSKYSSVSENSDFDFGFGQVSPYPPQAEKYSIEEPQQIHRMY